MAHRLVKLTHSHGVLRGSLNSETRIAFVGMLVVETAHRKTGIGRLLYEQFEQEAIREGCTCAVLEVFERNTNALAFWSKRGFAPTGECDEQGYVEFVKDNLEVDLGLAPSV